MDSRNLKSSSNFSYASFYSVMLIEQRLAELEHKVFKTAKKAETTRAQQMLLMHYLGALNPIMKLDITKEKKSGLLSVLLNSSPENLEKDLNALNQKDSYLKTSKNYNVLVKTFHKLGMKDLEKTCQAELDLILKKEENKKNKK